MPTKTRSVPFPRSASGTRRACPTASPKRSSTNIASRSSHGRVAQLAVLGYVAPETYRFGYDLTPDGAVNTNDLPNGIAAINALPFLGWVQILAFVGCVETYGWFTSPAGVLDLPDDILAKRQTAELQHGRLAMLAFLELIRHDSQNLAVPGFDGYDNLITGLPFIYN